MKIAVCINCGVERPIKAPREPIESYMKRRPYCVRCSQKNRIESMGGHGPGWKGGVRFLDNKGYVRVWSQKHKGYRKEHRLVYENEVGPIPEGYVIHHINEDKQDNRISNLVCMIPAEHNYIHRGHILKNHYNRRLKKVVSLWGK